MTDCETVSECKEVIQRLKNVQDHFLQEADNREVTDSKSIKDLKENLSQRENEIDSLQIQVKQLNDTLQDFEIIQQQNSLFQNQIKAKDRDLEDKEKLTVELQKSISDLIAQTEDLTEKIEKDEDLMAKAERELENLQIVENINDGLLEKIQKHEEIINQLSEENRMKELQIEAWDALSQKNLLSWQEKLSDREKLKTEIRKLEAETTEHGWSFKQKEKELTEIQEKLENQNRECNKIKGREKFLENELYRHMEEKESLLNDIKELRRNVNALARFRKEFQKEAEKESNTKQVLLTQINNLFQTKQSLEKQIEESNSSTGRMEENHKQLLESKEKEVKQLQEALADLENSNKSRIQILTSNQKEITESYNKQKSILEQMKTVFAAIMEELNCQSDTADGVSRCVEDYRFDQAELLQEAMQDLRNLQDNIRQKLGCADTESIDDCLDGCRFDQAELYENAIQNLKDLQENTRQKLDCADTESIDDCLDDRGRKQQQVTSLDLKATGGGYSLKKKNESLLDDKKLSKKDNLNKKEKEDRKKGGNSTGSFPPTVRAAMIPGFFNRSSSKGLS